MTAWQDELRFAVACARGAGERIRRIAAAGYRIDIKEDESPVTTADREVNAWFIERAQERYPRDRVLGEEADRDGDEARTWLIDPVDGTQQLILGIPVFMVSIALVADGCPVVGVACNPSTRECYWASAGGGAHRDGTPIRVSERDGRREPAIVCGEGADPNPGDLTSDTLLRVSLTPQLRGRSCRFPWPTVFSGCKVAEGVWDADLYGRTAPHDVAAVCLIVREAGGTVTDRHGDDQRYDRPVDGCLLSNGLIHSGLVEHWRPR